MEIKTIYLAGGCFWGTEHFVRHIKGVLDTEVGYANSILSYPQYKQVCTGGTNAAETVKVVYDSSVIDLSSLLELYYLTIDPTSVNKQGNDVGTQYRTGIYYEDNDDLATIVKSLEHLSKKYSTPLAVEVLPLRNFYPAEEYHQDYLLKNPAGYCHISPQLIDYIKNL